MPVPARTQRWLPLIRKYAAKYGVPAELLASIVDFESGGDPNAGHKTSGATGLGQVMPREAGFAGRPTRQELLDPEVNLDWSARILADGYKRWKTPQQAAAAYLGALDRNGNVTNAADANGTTGHAYVAKIMGNMRDFGAVGQGDASFGGQADQTGSSWADRLKVAAGMAPPTPDELAGRGFQPSGQALGQPTSGTPSPPGQRMWPVVGQRPGAVLNPFGGTQFHSAGSAGLNLPSSNTGADLVAQYGQQVVAEDDGVVVEAYTALGDSRSGQGRNAKENQGYGGSVTVQYRDGSKGRYSHMATGSTAVRPGQRVQRGQQLGLVGDSGNATGPHVDYMYWNPQGQLTDGTKQPGFTGGQVTAGGQGGMGQGGSSWADMLRVAAGMAPPTAAELAGAGGTKTGATPPTSPTPPTGRPAPSAQVAASMPPPTAEELGRPRDPNRPMYAMALDTGDTGAQGVQPMADPPIPSRAAATASAQPLIPAPGQPGIFSPSPSPSPTATPTPTPGAGFIPPDQPGSTTQGMGTPPAAPAGPPPGGAGGDAPPNTITGGPGENYVPPDYGSGPSDPAAGATGPQPLPPEEIARRRRQRWAPDIGEPPGLPEGTAANERFNTYRSQRARALEDLMTLREGMEAVKAAAAKAPDRTVHPGEDRRAADTRAQQEETAQKDAVEKLKQLEAAEAGLRRSIADADQNMATEVDRLKGTEGSNQNPVFREGPDGNLYRWDSKTNQWVPAEGFPGQPGNGIKVTAVDAGGFLALLGPDGHYYGKIDKTVGPETGPTVVGDANGPEFYVYNPRTGTLEVKKNVGYVNKPTQITAGQDVEFIVREDPITGTISYEKNKNYNPYSPTNRIVGSGAAEGKVMFVDREGKVNTVDLLNPAERKDIADKAHAETVKTVAEADKLKADAAAKAREQAALEEIYAAIDAGATPAQVRGLVQKAAKDVTDFVNIQKMETERQTQLEVGRHNLATEEAEDRERRTAEAGEARQGAQNYAQWGVATAPFQTALLGSLSQVADPRKVAGTMNIAPSVFEPVGQAWDKQQAGLAESAARRKTVQDKIDEPYTSPYTKPAGAAPAAPAAPAGAPAGQPPAGAQDTGPQERKPGQTYTGKPTGANQAIDLKDMGKPGWARTYYDDGTYEDWQIPGANPPMPAPQQAPGGGYYSGNPVGGTGGQGQGLGGGSAGGQTPPLQNPGISGQPSTPFPYVSQGPEQHGVGGYFVGGGEYDGHPNVGRQRMHPMYVSRYSPSGGGVGGGGAIGGGGNEAKRRRLPVPGKHIQVLGDGWLRTEYDDGALEDWHVTDGSAWEGIGGGGAGYWGEEPPLMHAAFDQAQGVGGGGSLWTLPPPPSMDPGWGAATALAQQGQGVPQAAPGREQPAGTAGGFAGPAAQQGGAGGGGAYGQGGEGGGTFGTNSPSRQAPMWDGASPAPFMSSGVAGPSGAAGQSTLYRPGAASGTGGGAGRGALSAQGGSTYDFQRSTAPPKTNGSYYGGPGMPQAMSPLQRLLQQTGVIPLSAGRAAGSPGTV